MCRDGVAVRRTWPSLRDASARLPALAADALAEAGAIAHDLDLIAVVAGPGSYTGLRASLAFAHGLALGGGARLIAVTVAEGWDASVGATTPDSVLVAAHHRRDGLTPPLPALPLYAGPAQARAAATRPAPT